MISELVKLGGSKSQIKALDLCIEKSSDWPSEFFSKQDILL